MHDDRKTVRDRLARTLRERLHPAVHRGVADLDVTAWHVQGGQGEPVPPATALSGPDRYAPFRVGDAWGPPWGTTWFHLTGTVPASAAGARVELRVDLGWADHSPGFQCEGLVYRPDGSHVKGLNPRNDWIPVAAPATGGETVDLYVEAAANPMVLGPDGFRPTAMGEKSTAGDRPLYRLARAEVSVLDEPVWDLVQDLEVLGQLSAELPDGDPRGWEILRAVAAALDALTDDVSASADAARAVLAPVLARPAHASAHRLSAVGHAHIDTAWLWPLRETVRKVTRTVANVVNLMDEHPDLVYAMSSAQQWAWLEEHHPALFARVAAYVRAGRFVPVGGMWVESDTNMPGGEAMARQFVHGKRYFLDRFGVDTPEVWLPDSFGYSAALPQLVRLAGSRWFLTQKISWNQVNPFPHHTFWWEGLDGTRVFTHFPPVDTYNCELSGRELAHAVRNFRDKGTATRSLVPFGYGDGGGGPTRQMLARARRTADLEGSPRVALEPPAAFFAAAEREYAHAPVWVGELYLEIHRGTYTSQAQTKQGNRRSEHLLREAELWCATATVRHGAPYPYDELDRAWKTVLLHQFHDILPGSSIAWVHREARETYARLTEDLTALIGSAQQHLAGTGTGLDHAPAQAGVAGDGTGPDGASGGTAGPPGGGPPRLVFNAAPYPRDGVPALGAAPVGPAGAPVSVVEGDGGAVLDNGLLRVVVDNRGLVTSLRDLVADREVLPPGQVANLLQIHPDQPNRWDAWDVDAFYRDRVTDLTEPDGPVRVEAGPHGVTVRVTRRFGDSGAVQQLTLRPGERSLELRTEVDWRESERLLKLAFPVDVHTDRAAYETQFGHLYRPTHENTSWDAARFEVCAHRWVRVAEPDYGVALANDGTYGHDVRRIARPGGGTATVVRASLLRAPRFPDPLTDHGVHTFRHVLVPGAELSDAYRAGYAVNLPPRALPAGQPVDPLVRVEGAPSVLVEAVKLADDRSGDVVVRLYEAHGTRAHARLVPSFPFVSFAETDLLERDLPPDATSDRAADGHGVHLRLRPFQIRTLRLRPAG